MNDECSALSAARSDILLVGGGKMGLAMLTGWLSAGLAPGLLRVVDPSPSPELLAQAKDRGFRVEATVGSQAADVVVMAVKPQVVGAVAAATSSPIGPGCTVLSIMAGITLERLRALFPRAGQILRAMPNLPASVGRGATLLVSEANAGPEGRAFVQSLLEVSGTVEAIDDERLMDAGTALSGSGPGYLFYVVECLAKAGERAGLPPEVAARLARQTLVGAGALLAASGKSAADLRKEVTSPGGTTEAGIAALADDERLAGAFGDAIRAAAARSRELAH